MAQRKIRDTKYRKAEQSRKIAQIANDLYKSGKVVVSIDNIAEILYPNGYGEGALSDLRKRKFSAREILENTYGLDVALICQEFLDDGCPVITEEENTWKYLPDKTFRPANLFVFGSKETSMLVSQSMGIRGKFGDAKIIKRTQRIHRGYDNGWLDADSAVAVISEPQQTIDVKSPTLKIEGYAVCRKFEECSNQLPPGEAIKAHWWYSKATKKWTCLMHHSQLMLTYDNIPL